MSPTLKNSLGIWLSCFWPLILFALMLILLVGVCARYEKTDAQRCAEMCSPHQIKKLQIGDTFHADLCECQ